VGRYFGTDGIRGEANKTLTVHTAFKIGQFLGHYYKTEQKGKVLIGKDTRISSSMLEHALIAGICSGGSDAYLMHVGPTPAVAYLARTHDFNCGVMISASHNPYYDNGIKIFDHSGTKIADDLEAQLEDFIDDEFRLPLASDTMIGESIDFQQGLDDYLNWMENLFDFDLKGYRVIIDVANGSATTTAKRLFEKLGADVVSMYDTPNGVNINNHCGSTHPDNLQKAVLKHKANFGFAFDGDADRLIAVDELGQLVDGDKIMYACGVYLNRKKQLKKNTVVATVMSNLGLFKALNHMNVSVVQTQVGDKYVYQQMIQDDYTLGGEQSGHIIFKDLATTGDGLLTAMKLIEVVVSQQQPLSEIVKPCQAFPQVLKNVSVKDKKSVLDDLEINQLIVAINDDLNDSGRILVRPSGTESLIRVMVEADQVDKCHHYVDQVIDMIVMKGL
jgi:phosphoglucosamine mutase